MNWRAKWIWARSHAPNFYIYARREFEASKHSTSRVYITCSGEYKLYLNGRYVGRGKWDGSYDGHDVSHIIRPGKNVIAAICYAGSHVPGGLLLQLEMSNSNGTVVIASDENWRVKPADDWDFNSSIISEKLGFSEVYDSRKKPIGWNIVGYDDSEWDTPDVSDDFGFDLLPRDIPQFREWEVFPERVVECSDCVKYAKSLLDASANSAVVNASPESFVIIDFGREVVGYPMIRVRDGSAAGVDVNCRETLTDIQPHDRVILHGGRQVWEAFNERAFRYLHLTFRDVSAPIHIESVSINCVGYPVEQVSTFECSDDLLNHIWRTGVYTLSLCMRDTFNSHPLAEQAQNPEGARVQALANYYCFFDSMLAAKTLRKFAKYSDDLSWILMLHDYYLYTGDKGLVEELYQNLHKLMQDWEKISNNILLRQTLRAAAKLAFAVDDVDNMVEWMSRAEVVPQASDKKNGTFHPDLKYIRQRWGDLLKTDNPWREWAVDPTYILPAEVLGMKPSMPESGVIVVKPNPGDLSWAKGKIKTHTTTVNIEWRSSPDEFTLEIDAPEGFIAAIPVGGFRNPQVEEIDLSPETPERRARRTYGWSDMVWRDGVEHDPYVDWLTTQEAQPPSQYKKKKRLHREEEYIWVRESATTHVRYRVSESP